MARASDLEGRDRTLYRALECLPGALAWGTIGSIILLSFFAPVWGAFFVIAFDVYWILRSIYFSAHLRHNWRRLRYNMRLDWKEKLKPLPHSHLAHLVLLPFFDEDENIMETSLLSLAQADYDPKKIFVVLGAEERAGDAALARARRMEERFHTVFGAFLVTIHPRDLPGDIPGKGSNIAYAAEEARRHILDPRAIPYENVLVSAFDIDSVILPQYFLCLSWHFLTAPEPMRSSFQPVPLYNNNLWDAPVLSRVAALMSTFWQMIQQERVEKLATFSSHSLCFKPLHEAGYWQRNVVSEDSRIFWNLLFAFDGDWRVVPLSYPILMDANLAPTFWNTLKNIYKQHRRWMWGVENIPYILFGFIKNARIPRKKKWMYATTQIEGFWSLATNPLIILCLGWLPIILGGAEFRDTVLSYNLPRITRDLMTFSLVGLILLAVIAISLAPHMHARIKRPRLAWALMILQWILVPISIVIFTTIPGLEAQTRLMTKRYLGFWVTEKHRIS